MNNNTWLGRWLAAGVVMLLVQILLGGITRLTGSGLSITEWQPLLGALPPLTESEWQRSFFLYQQIAQFKKINSGFSLSDYQHIYFWEWLHREWARLMALVFIIPLVIFLAKRMIGKQLLRSLIILFLLGMLQGAIGWIMVKSGLNDTDVRVSHIRLAIHFLCALLLLCYLFWLMLSVYFPQKRIKPVLKPDRLLYLLLFLTIIQLCYGAFMAGTHAALSAPTWPDINGSLISIGLFTGDLFYKLLYDPLMIQFIHRGLAYLIMLLLLVWVLLPLKNKKRISWLRRLPLLLIVIQVCLGVLALLTSMLPHAIYYNVLHQLNGILFLLALVGNIYKHFGVADNSISTSSYSSPQ